MKNKKQDISFERYLFHFGNNMEAYNLLGAFPITKSRRSGVLFRVWAPRAKSVSLVCDLNNWIPGVSVFERMADDDSIFEIFIPKMMPGDAYKFAITGSNGKTILKNDPYALETQQGPMSATSRMASVVVDRNDSFEWNDKLFLTRRRKNNSYSLPMNIYEVHLGSWKRNPDGSYFSFRQYADQLLDYVKSMKYTHVELLPITEYPFDGSWGYQVTGYFSLTSRYGKAEDFCYFVNRAHELNIGVIMDWVPAHFPKDSIGLIEFDGEPLYEDSNEKSMEHLGWGTRAFDYSRPEVRSFLISSANFFIEKFHIDGIRVDAVAAMLYLDYERDKDNSRKNDIGGRENLEAVEFLQSLNEKIHKAHPGVLTIAEESSTWPGVTAEPKGRGLGFSYKWNMGWMNDTLEYMKTDPLFRGGIHNKLTFASSYAYSENFVLPISHDEVVHGKNSMIGKMSGNYAQKFETLKAFYVFMMTHPGKKLTFMGTEFAQFSEWSESRGLDWMLFEYEAHANMNTFVKELNTLYIRYPQLWVADGKQEGFRWIDADNSEKNVFSFMRINTEDKKADRLLIILNFSGLDYTDFKIGVPKGKRAGIIFDSNSRKYGGNNLRNKILYDIKTGECNGYDQHITIPLPQRSGVILKIGSEE